MRSIKNEEIKLKHVNEALRITSDIMLRAIERNNEKFDKIDIYDLKSMTKHTSGGAYHDSININLNCNSTVFKDGSTTLIFKNAISFKLNQTIDINLIGSKT